MGDLMSDISKELVPKVYEDVAQQSLKSIGELLSLFPRAAKALFSSLEIWTLNNEAKVNRVKILLELTEKKLKDLSPEQIVSPEVYIAVPALQSVSYCMNNHELRDMYANLLASSMNKVVKDGVHPSYVEVIRQLCPDEAKILKYVAEKETIPTISVYYGNSLTGFNRLIKDFSDVGNITYCEKPLDVCRYFGNLVRLGLIEIPDSSPAIHYPLSNEQLYEPLKKNSYIQSIISAVNLPKNAENEFEIIKNHVVITDYGKGFCTVCLNVSHTSVIEKFVDKSRFLTNDNVATDEDINEMLNEVFGSSKIL